MPSWGLLYPIGSMLVMAAKLAKHELGKKSLSVDTAGVLESLEVIQKQTDSIYGAQLPMMDLVSDAIRTVRKIEEQQAASAPLLDKVVQSLERPGRRQAEKSLRDLLGDVYPLLAAEAKVAAVEGELRFLQGDCIDASVIPKQFAKAFELQLSTRVTGPYRLQIGGNELSLHELEEALQRRDPKFRDFLKQNGVSPEALLNVLLRVRLKRNRAVHEVGISLIEAEQIRADWLGVHDRTTCIFRALVPRR